MSDNKEDRYNPLGTDTIDKMLAKKKAELKAKEAAEEEIQDYIKAINRLFASEDGKFFLNKMKRACGINSFDKEINPAKLIEDRGRGLVWFELIRPYLDVNILRELEQ